ncbi:MAG: helix-turn-helix domain-containing protein [Spirochaetota bacterium]
MENKRTHPAGILPVNWSVLVRNIVVYLAITAACLGAVGLLAVRFSSEHIMRQTAASSRRALASKVAILEERLDKADSLTYQTVYNDKVFRLIWSGDSGASSLLVMRDVIRSFESIVQSHEWITSIYFYDSRQDYVLGDTKTDKASFSDQSVLAVPKRDALSVIGSREAHGGQTLSFTRSFPFFSRRLTAFVVVNVGYDAFFDTLLPGDESSRFVVVDELGEVVYPLSAAPLGTDPTAVLAADPAGATMTIGGTRYSVVQDRTETLEWRVLYLQPYDEVVSATALVRRLILTSVVGVLILSGFLLWATTRRLQEPLSVLVKQARGLVGPTAEQRNEYEVVDSAIRSLLAKNLELNERYRTALPYFRRYSLEEFLHTESWDTDRFDAILSMLGVHLRRSHLHVAIAEARERTKGSLLRRAIESYLQSHEETLTFVAAETHDGRVTIILNTDSDAHTVYVVVSGLRDFLVEQGFLVSLALSTQFEDTAEIPPHFDEAEEQLDHRAFFGDEAVIYDFNRATAPVTVDTPYVPHEPVLAAIREQDQEEACDALREFSRAVSDRSEGDVTYVRFAFFELGLRIDRILPESVHDEDEFERRRRLYTAVHESAHTDELSALISDMITTTIRELHRVKSEHHEELVRRSIRYLEQHLGESISVEDVAEAVFISGRYLNMIFKAHTGSTVFEYLSTLRLCRAEELLHDPSLQIQEVAARVGYENVQSFTRLFKRHHGMTPVEYRRAGGQSA